MIGLGLVFLLVIIALTWRLVRGLGSLRQPVEKLQMEATDSWWTTFPYFGVERVCGGRDQYCMCSGDEIR